ncbi:MAG TPA: hypothetical protein PKX47_06850, partial [Smithellaceae bacterium]|nr:hypothetical protein [Smithellaceae bacterium]HOD64515.1 hypothetical protein [Smithellaceae bacterium]HOH57663.1 hypothetical protein [Smithellaceae bacterium]HPI51938.1 hypothetical protein [Smithellaceae bacterium]HPV72546.1 hypothetical protein [Smithellaceae bacterium]
MPTTAQAPSAMMPATTAPLRSAFWGEAASAGNAGNTNRRRTNMRQGFLFLILNLVIGNVSGVYPALLQKEITD